MGQHLASASGRSPHRRPCSRLRTAATFAAAHGVTTRKLLGRALSSLGDLLGDATGAATD